MDSRRYYPLLVDLTGKSALVVGGGEVAARKLEMLLEYGARVTVVAPSVVDRIRQLAADGTIVWHERRFDLADLDHPWIVFAATNDPQVHRVIKSTCDERRIFCNVVDVTDECSFIVPSIIRRGELMITISTDGLCPAYSKYQRKRMEACCFPVGCESALHLAAHARRVLKGRVRGILDDEAQFAILREVIETEIPGLLGLERTPELEQKLAQSVLARAERALQSNSHSPED